MSSAMAATISHAQLTCFSAIHTHRSSILIRRPSLPFSPSFGFNKLSVVMNLERHSTDTSGSDSRNTVSYAADSSELNVEERQKPHITKEDHGSEKTGSEEAMQEGVSQPKRAAKIHDFCLGIPFGGFVLTGGIIGFLFSRSTATLSSGVLFGGALLFLSTLSMKVWRQGKSSLPFILGQAALAGILIWKNFQSYSLAKKVFPNGLSAIISSAMLCFYLYVLISGGNPPPKKLKQSVSTA